MNALFINEGHGACVCVCVREREGMRHAIRIISTRVRRHVCVFERERAYACGSVCVRV